MNSTNEPSFEHGSFKHVLTHSSPRKIDAQTMSSGLNNLNHIQKVLSLNEYLENDAGEREVFHRHLNAEIERDKKKLAGIVLFFRNILLDYWFDWTRRCIRKNIVRQEFEDKWVGLKWTEAHQRRLGITWKQLEGKAVKHSIMLFFYAGNVDRKITINRIRTHHIRGLKTSHPRASSLHRPRHLFIMK